VWRRTLRTGHADAELAWRHRRSPARDRWREALSAVAWGVGLPAAVALAALRLSPWWLALLAAYPLLCCACAPARAGRGRRGRRHALRQRVRRAKLPQALGVLRFGLGLARLLPRRGLIE